MDAPESATPTTGLALTRRTFLAGVAGTAGAIALAGCGGDDADSESGTNGDGDADGEGQVNLLALFPPQGVLITGSEQRTTFALSDFEGVPIQEIPTTLDFSLRRDGEEIEIITATAQAKGIPTGYYPVRFTPPDVGDYEITTTYQGAELLPRAFVVSAPDEVSIPTIGDAMIPVDTPTTADARGVDPICTLTPECPLHDVTLTEALDEGRPVAFLIATPEFCQTALCGPVLDVLLASVDTHPDIRFVHAEVFADARAVDNIAQATLAEAPGAFDLPFEPALFLANSDSTINARLDNLYGTEELEAELAKLS